MSFFRFACVLVAVSAVVSGCAKPVDPRPELMMSRYMAEDGSAIGQDGAAISIDMPAPRDIFTPRRLAGRTLEVATTEDIVLRRGEVVLTFDDGPRAGRTPAILDTLERFGVKATFLMLGAAAKANPELAQTVALRGHTVGSHTYDHIDLTTLSRQDAIAEIVKGENAVADALAGAGQKLSPFFRFPYLSQNGFLRTSLLQSGAVVLDVDVDSKDFYRDSPAAIAQRTLARLETRGSGIILFHDVHQRTVDMLPDFLDELARRGYSVVRLVPRKGNIFGRDLITADMRLDDIGLDDIGLGARTE